MAGFASQAALRSHYEDLIDEAENDAKEKLSSAVCWFKQVVWTNKPFLLPHPNLHIIYDTLLLLVSKLENVAQNLAFFLFRFDTLPRSQPLTLLYLFFLPLFSSSHNILFIS